MRTRFALLAALAAVLATMVPVSAPAATFTNVRLPGVGKGEPGVALAPNGTVFVNAPSGSGTVWKGSGSTFTRGGFDSVSRGTGDTDLAVAPDDGTVYAVNLSDSFSNLVYVSTNNGASYTGPSLAGVNSDRQWLTAGVGGVVYMTYHDIGQLGSQNIWVLRSTDHGKTFVPRGNVALTTPVAYAEAATICGDITDRIHIDPTDPTGNTLFMSYGLGDVNGCAAMSPTSQDIPINQAWVARSVDGGQTWASTEVAGQLLTGSGGSVTHLFPSLAIDSAGAIYVTYAKTGPGTETHIMMHTSTDHGVTWSSPVRVDQLSGNAANVMPSIDASVPGRIDIAFYTSPGSNWNASSSQWVVADVRSTNASSATPIFTQSQVSTGVVHLGGICTAGLNCLVTGGNRTLLDFLDVAIDSAGLANVVWANDNGTLGTYYGRG